jgi:Hemerythrin HHE cation binding domain
MTSDSTTAAAAQGSIYRMLAADHARLDDLLARAAINPEGIDSAPYDAFRRGLLKHIAMEEKILLPAALRLNGGEPLAIAARLRLDHGAIAALLVPTPNRQIVAALKTILAAHNALEEGAGGLYETCDRLASVGSDEIIAQLAGAPEVPMAPHNDGPKVIPAARRALARAGYNEALLAEQ